MSTGLKPEVLVVIPARFGSTRFEGKVIAPLAGKPLVMHVYDRASSVDCVSKVLIATDDERVRDAIAPFAPEVVMTRPDHPSGTDRMAEVAMNESADIVVNVQGDEPFIDPRTIQSVIDALIDNPDIPMATARRIITDQESVQNPNVVKVVCDKQGRALYFSRNPIPYPRDKEFDADMGCWWQHIGLYAYRRDFLLDYANMKPTPLEELEKLEQLRVLENGYAIAVVDTEYESIGVDTPEDLELVKQRFEATKGESE